MYRWEIMNRVASERVISIIRAGDADQAFQMGSVALSAGLAVVEISLTTPGSLEVIAQLTRDDPTAVIGAGTVLDEASATAAATAGARLLVSPTLAPEVIRTGHRYGAAVIPGCSTATEMLKALEHGADAVKLFPATTWRPSGLASLRQALPQVACIPTGGVSIEAARAWIVAGAIALGIGSALTTGGPSAVRRRAEELKRELASDLES